MNEQLINQFIASQGELNETMVAMLNEMSGVALKQQGHTGTLLHGPGGMFNTPGLDEAVISTHVRSMGLGQLLPAFPSRSKTPQLGFVIGFAAETGSQPDYPCDPAPSGTFTSGTLTAKFGRVAKSTEDIYVPDTLWQNNTGETLDLRLVGALNNPESMGLYQPSDQPSDQSLLENVTNAEQLIAGQNMERTLSYLLWSGDGTGTNDTTNLGYVEPPGLDTQIATGQVDANVAATNLPSLDSLILDLTFTKIDDGSFNIVAPVSYMESHLRHLSIRTGTAPVRWVLVMTPQMWEALTEVWPIAYATHPNYALMDGTGVSGRYNATTDAIVAQRDAMRNSMTLVINGRTYDVVTDDWIVELDDTDVSVDADHFASNIYFIPLSIGQINFPVLYWEYLDHKLSVSQSGLPGNMVTWFSDAGRFLWTIDVQRACFNLMMETNVRAVLRTPHLAGKIQNVQFGRPYFPLRSPDPASSRFVGGGVGTGTRPGPTTYSVWG